MNALQSRFKVHCRVRLDALDAQHMSRAAVIHHNWKMRAFNNNVLSIIEMHLRYLFQNQFQHPHTDTYKHTKIHIQRRIFHVCSYNFLHMTVFVWLCMCVCVCRISVCELCMKVFLAPANIATYTFTVIHGEEEQVCVFLRVCVLY